MLIAVLAHGAAGREGQHGAQHADVEIDVRDHLAVFIDRPCRDA